mmetsp:Transcript_27600/g.91652  ORF Transcript_27600/g.91652 Transcript_27600/m.91652 type:complete len:91 (-) Transcript_27600:88-360(-)
MLILRKKMKHQARSRDDGLLGNYLGEFADRHADDLQDQELLDWQELMECDCETVMNLVAGYQEASPELDTPLLQRMRKDLVDSPPRNPFA